MPQSTRELAALLFIIASAVLILLHSCAAAATAGDDGLLSSVVILFADDYYKVQGAPELLAVAQNPVLSQGNQRLCVVLANHGRLQALIPTGVGTGGAENAASEMKEEVKALDILNLEATLSPTTESDSRIYVASGTIRISSLPAGSSAPVMFDIEVGGDLAQGSDSTVDMTLNADYERQIDVKVEGNSSSPLYIPVHVAIPIQVRIIQNAPMFKVDSVKSSLTTGKNGTILLLLRNDGDATAYNCSLKLISSNPFRSAGTYLLGDILARNTTLARAGVMVLGNATSGKHQISAEIRYDGGASVLLVQVDVEEQALLPQQAFRATMLLGAGVVLAAALLIMRQRISSRSIGFMGRRSRRKFKPRR